MKDVPKEGKDVPKTKEEKTYEQHLALAKDKKSENMTQSAKIIAKKTGENVNTVRGRIRRGKKKKGDPIVLPQKKAFRTSRAEGLGVWWL